MNCPLSDLIAGNYAIHHSLPTEFPFCLEADEYFQGNYAARPACRFSTHVKVE